MVNPRRFDPVSLRIYAAVFESGSLTAGAAAFGISLAAASKRISELEHDAGARLFERGASLLRLLGTAANTLGRPLKVGVQVRSFDAMCRKIALGIGVLPLSAAALAAALPQL